MAMNIKKARDILKQKLSHNPDLQRELHISSAQDLAKVSDQQLESMLSTKVLGLLSISRKDLEK